MKRRKTGHDSFNGVERRRREMLRARQAKQDNSPVCPRCRKATFPSRATARRHLRDLESRPDFVDNSPPGKVRNVYRCPAGHGWHWGHTRPEQFRSDEQAS